MTFRSCSGFVLLVLLASACSQAEEPLGVVRAELPSGFTQTTVASVSEPTALAFLPDGTMLVNSRSGQVRAVKNGTNTQALDLTSKVCANRERGLLGIAVDPQFAANKFVYLYYTFKKSNCDIESEGAINRVVRYSWEGGKLTGEKVILDHILSWNGWHNAGDLQFGADGYLYVGVGDSGAKYKASNTGWGNDNSRWKSLLSGKVLRIRKEDGAPAPSNPFMGAGSWRCGDPAKPAKFIKDNNQPCQETFAWGLRNPFRIPFIPGTDTFFINEVGQNIGGDWEEVNQGKKGADYGWNKNQGKTSDGATENPVYAYAIGENVGGSPCRCITGGTFVSGGAWPAGYEGSYLFGDYTCGVLFQLKKNGSSWTRSTFATGLGGSSVVHMAFGPGPNGPTLYYTTFNGNKVVRVDPPASANKPPSAVIAASPTSGPAPLLVSFDGSASSDPDVGDGIGKYIWDFGDGTTQTTTGPTVKHTYSTAGSFTAKLTVEDKKTPPKTDSASVSIHPGNTPPTIAITGPFPAGGFVVGKSYNLTATATDAQDGALPAGSISWVVKKNHDNDHTHPFFSGTGNNIPIVFDGPEGLAAAEESNFLVEATVTDSKGLTATDKATYEPHRVQVTFATDPPGLSLSVEEDPLLGPTQITAWEGWPMHVKAGAQVVGGTSYQFSSWSDGGAAGHTIVAPGSDKIYTAKFVEGSFSAKINFQLGSAVTPAGYLEDDGALFGARDGGLSYGWNQDNQFAARERNNPASPDKRYDTTVLMQKSGNKKWELAVPNGTYHVRLVAGDADHFDSTFVITAEGKTIVNGAPTSASRWIEGETDVTVSDGRLTIDNGTGSKNNKLCFIEVTAGAAPPPFAAKVNFQPAGSPAVAGHSVDDGTPFAARGGGLSYGWNQDNSGATRDRGLLDDQRYDTCILPQKTGNKLWELAVPSGTYQVRIVAGDAGYFDSTFDFTLEGQPALTGKPTSAERFVEATVTVEVSDGRLTLDNGPTAVNNKLAFVEISQL